MYTLDFNALKGITELTDKQKKLFLSTIEDEKSIYCNDGGSDLFIEDDVDDTVIHDLEDCICICSLDDDWIESVLDYVKQ